MPKTIRNLLDNLLGADTRLGRALRAPTNFLLRRATAEMRRETKSLSSTMAKMSQKTKAMHDNAKGLHKKMEALHREMAALHKETAALAARMSNLEALLLEHPKAHSGKSANFPSPAVSIIMPTWNRAGLIAEAIESVLAQSFADWELIIVDDGSTDNTDEVVARFADSRIRYHRKDHAGQCAARNHALRLAKGTLVAYLDSDNIWYPGFLSLAVAAFAADSSVESAYGARVSEARNEMCLLFEPFDREKLLKRSFIGMSCFIHRRALYERFGGFDEDLCAYEDWDLALRYTEETPARRLPVLAVRYRAIDANRVTAIEAMAVNREKVFRKWRLV